jgi:uncharacterized protein (TIGR00369 family)
MTISIPQLHYSNASSLLGMKVNSFDRELGVLEASFVAHSDFFNRAGNIQGGIVTAMLDDLMGYALGLSLPADKFAPTANLNVSFLRPAKTGALSGRGQILKREGAVYHLAGKLYNEAGELVAAATSKAKLGNLE